MAASIMQGAPDWRVVHRPATGRHRLACWIALPREMEHGATPIVAVHGIKRGAQEQAELLAPAAAAAGRPVIAPLFDEERWSRYQQVVREGRADLALIALMGELRVQGVWRTPRFDLSGFSGGAQFAHRFAMLHPQLVERLTVASAGWWTFPDDAPFPYGLGRRPEGGDDWGPHLESRLADFLRIRVTVCVGAADNMADANTRRGPKIDEQQGTNRATRARRWSGAMNQAAKARGLPPRVTFRTLARCGHDFTTCVEQGAFDRLVVGSGTTTDPERVGRMAGAYNTPADGEVRLGDPFRAA